MTSMNPPLNPARIVLLLFCSLLAGGALLAAVGSFGETPARPIHYSSTRGTHKRASVASNDTDSTQTKVNNKNRQLPLENEVLSRAPKDDENLGTNRSWQKWAIEKLWEERRQMGYTPIVRFKHLPNTLLVFKDESAARSENLKHRFAWALFFWAVLEGHLRNGTTVYEASSGNTALSELFMAKLIGSSFVAVVPDTTEPAKVEHIEQAGGMVIKVPFGKMQEGARELAEKNENGFFMNQFGNADLAEEFHQSQHGQKLAGIKDRSQGHESSNIFYELYEQMNDTAPDFFVHSAATGGTLSSVGRFVKKYDLPTQVVLADPEYSLYYDYVISGRFDGRKHLPERLTAAETTNLHSKWVPPGIAGTGFGSLWGLPVKRRTSSLVPSVVDRVLKVPDLASVAAMQVLSERYGISGGPSTGLNFVAALELVAKRRLSGSTETPLTVATLICDKGKNYQMTYYNRTWVGEHFEPHGGLTGLDCWRRVVGEFLDDASKGGQLGYSPIGKGASECAIGRVVL